MISRPDWDMSVSKDPNDYSVVVRKRSETIDKWRWEIRRVGRSLPVKASQFEFFARSAAATAAAEALKLFLQSLQG